MAFFCFPIILEIELGTSWFSCRRRSAAESVWFAASDPLWKMTSGTQRQRATGWAMMSCTMEHISWNTWIKWWAIMKHIWLNIWNTLELIQDVDEGIRPAVEQALIHPQKVGGIPQQLGWLKMDKISITWLLGWFVIVYHWISNMFPCISRRLGEGYWPLRNL